MSSATFRHLNHTSPSGATKVERPNGSSLLPWMETSGVAVGSTEASWILRSSLSCEARPACFAITSLMVKMRAGARAGVPEISGAMVAGREDAVAGSAAVSDPGGAASEAMTKGFGGGSACADLAGSTRVVSCGANAMGSPAATLATTGTLLAAVALVSRTDTATKPRNSTTGSH